MEWKCFKHMQMYCGYYIAGQFLSMTSSLFCFTVNLDLSISKSRPVNFTDVAGFLPVLIDFSRSSELPSFSPSFACRQPPNKFWYGSYVIWFLKRIFLTYRIIATSDNCTIIPQNIAELENIKLFITTSKPGNFFSCFSCNNLFKKHDLKMTKRANEHAVIQQQSYMEKTVVIKL